MARALVNAAGPWAGAVDQCIEPRPAAFPVDLVQGAHLVMQAPLQAGCYYVEAPLDRRAVFLLPWGEHSLLGTTEHRYSGNPRNVRLLPEEETYLLDVQQHYFPDRSTTVLDRFAGLRVLPVAGGAAFGRSRETHLLVDNPRKPRTLSIYGGKLTGYRATADKVIDKLRHSLPSRKAHARTDTLKLVPAD
jgi:glycerol-3-phosphate dehydrogenase